MTERDERASAQATSKGQHTRAAIIDAALDLFDEAGYDGTTMREIARRAGVSVGNAYYYFRSKDDLVQGFYDRAAATHATASAAALQGVTALDRRITAHLDSWFVALAPYHRFATQFFRTAADPASPLSPFSADSAPARTAAIEMWADVVRGSELTPSASVAERLPEVLWLFQMGLVMMWVHDRSADQAATRLAVAAAGPLVARAIALTDHPDVAPLVADVTAMLALAAPLLGTAS